MNSMKYCLFFVKKFMKESSMFIKLIRRLLNRGIDNKNVKHSTEICI